MSTTKAKRLSHRVQYTGEEHVENFRVTVAIEKALKTLERHSAYLVVSRYFRRWILRATLTLRRDSLVAEVCAGRIATAQPPASPTTTTGASGCCSSCGTSSSAINELRALAARLHHRVAQRDRMISYLASQRDAAVRWSDRVVHAAVLTQHQRVDAHASMLGQALSVAPPPPPPPHHPSLGTAHASGNDGSAANVSRHVIDPLMALLAIPVPVEAELRARIASLESRLMALGEDPRRVAWPKRPNPSTADLLKRKVTSSTSVPLALSSVATNEQPEAKVAVASSARRSQSAAPPSTTQNRRSLGGSLDGAGAPTSPLSPSGSGASPADPIVAWMDPSPRTAAAAVDDPQASRESPTPHASDTIDEEEPGDTDEPPSARRSTGPHALVTTPARGLVRRSEATAGLSTLDVEPMSGRSSSNNNNSGTTMVAHSVTSGQRQPTVDPSWPVAPTQYATGRPLRLHRVPAEMLQILQPAPIHNRGFAPSQARVALTVKRTGVAHPAANATQRSQSGQNRSDAFRVVPQRQPAMGVAPVSASTQAAVATAKKAGSRGS